MSTSDRRPPPAPPAGTLRNPKIEAALDRAVALGDPAELVSLLDRSSGLPARRGRAPGPELGPNAPAPRANLELARAAGAAIAAHGLKAERLLRALAASPDEYPLLVAAQAFAALASRGEGARAALAAMQELAEDPRRVVRGDSALAELSAWTDGYLQAHVALEALADRTLLARLAAGAELVARLDEAFALADVSPRADERLQGLRLLRQRLPAQIAIFSGRFPEVLRWFEAKTSAERPETREVVAETIAALRKSSFPDAEAARLAAALSASAPIPRYAARIVQGTRKRSKGRR